MQKNTAGKWIVFAYGLPDHASDGQPITGDAANITANVYIDGAAANAVDDTNPAELGFGYYSFDITAAEANGDNIIISPVSSTGSVQVIGVPGAVWTRPPNFEALGIETDGDLTKVNLVATTTTNTDMLTAAAVNSEVDTALADYDGPTKAEMDTGHGLLATEAKQDIIDTNIDQIEAAVITNATGVDIAADIIAMKAETVLIVQDTGTTIPGTITTMQGNVTDILADTADIQPNYATEAKQDIMDTNIDQIETAVITNATGTDIAADIIAMKAETVLILADTTTMTDGIITGTAATGTLSTTVATSSLTGYTDDQLIGRIITFLAGPADGESSDITDYASTGGTITFTAMTFASENGNAFKIT